MKGIFWAIVFIVIGCWIWNKYSSGINYIYKESASVTTTMKTSIDSAKVKIKKPWTSFKNLTKEFENEKK